MLDLNGDGVSMFSEIQIDPEYDKVDDSMIVFINFICLICPISLPMQYISITMNKDGMIQTEIKTNKLLK